MIVEISGRSMEPALAPGWRVRVAPIDGPVAPGDLILFRTRSGGLELHRAVHCDTLRGKPVVFHRGDATGRMGLVAREAVLGRAVELVCPERRPLPWPLACARARRAFERAHRICRLSVLAHRLMAAAGVPDGLVRRAAAAYWRVA